MATLAQIIAALPSRLFRAADGPQTEGPFTIPSSPPYTQALGTGAPFSNPAGYPIVPPNITNNVTLSGGRASWSQVTPGSPLATGLFSVTTTSDQNGGVLSFAAADAGVAGVTAQWTGSNLVNENLLGSLLSFVQGIFASIGAPSGLAPLDSAGRLLSSMLPTTIAATKFAIPAQTGNTSATYVPNLTLGWFGLPAGNADGSTVVVANTAVSANSAIFLQVQGNPGGDNVLTPKVSARVAGTTFSFVVHTRDLAVTSTSVDILYIIIN